MSVCFLLVGENPGNEVEETADILWRRDWFPRNWFATNYGSWSIPEADQNMGTR